MKLTPEEQLLVLAGGKAVLAALDAISARETAEKENEKENEICPACLTSTCNCPYCGAPCTKPCIPPCERRNRD